MEIHSQKVRGMFEANVNIPKENQDNQTSNNEVEDLMLKGHPLVCDGVAFVGICGRDEEL